jgi:hypothetical protein
MIVHNFAARLFLFWVFVPALPALADGQCPRCRHLANGTYAVEMPRDGDHNCALCNRVIVGAYDVQLPPRPTTNAARFNDWMFLYYIGGSLKAALLGTDSCTFHEDGALLNAVTTGNGTMRSGAGSPTEIRCGVESG